MKPETREYAKKVAYKSWDLGVCETLENQDCKKQHEELEEMRKTMSIALLRISFLSQTGGEKAVRQKDAAEAGFMWGDIFSTAELYELKGTKFLAYVLQGNENAVKAMLEQDPSLQDYRGTAHDKTGRIYKDVTAFGVFS